MNYLIYGAGHFGECFYRILVKQKLQVNGWIDQRLVSQMKYNLPIFDEHTADRNMTVIVAVTPLVNSNRGQIKERLQGLGYNNVLGFFEAAREFPEVFKEYAQLEHLWMRTSHHDMLNLPSIKWLRARLGDDKSKNILDKLCAFRASLSIDDYPEPDRKIEYFPDDIPFNFQSPIRFIDCGAYTGDTVEAFVELHKKNIITLEHISSFEPDTNNYQTLTNTQNRLKKNNPEISFQAFPSGVWKCVDLLNFNQGQTSSSNIIQSEVINDSSVSVVDLDSTCQAMDINYIKMDIEGAELAALEGAKSLIQTQQPVLAICVYHKPKDLWELPQFIDQLQPNYDMYLRVHEHLGLSTVLYCIPKGSH